MISVPVKQDIYSQRTLGPLKPERRLGVCASMKCCYGLVCLYADCLPNLFLLLVLLLTVLATGSETNKQTNKQTTHLDFPNLPGDSVILLTCTYVNPLSRCTCISLKVASLYNGFDSLTLNFEVW